VDIAAANAGTSTLVAALEAAGLDAALRGEGPFTVFAPVNPAFSALGSDVVAALLEEANEDLLTRILTFHVVAGETLAADLSNGQTLTTLEGSTLSVAIAGGNVTINGARVTTADIEATNGVIHLIDAVMVPPVDIVERAVL